MNEISASKNSPNKFIVGSVSVVTAKTITVPVKNSFPMSLMNFVRIVFAAVVPSWEKKRSGTDCRFQLVSIQWVLIPT